MQVLQELVQVASCEMLLVDAQPCGNVATASVEGQTAAAASESVPAFPPHISTGEALQAIAAASTSAVQINRVQPPSAAAPTATGAAQPAAQEQAGVASAAAMSEAGQAVAATSECVTPRHATATDAAQLALGLQTPGSGACLWPRMTGASPNLQVPWADLPQPFPASNGQPQVGTTQPQQASGNASPSGERPEQEAIATPAGTTSNDGNQTEHGAAQASQPQPVTGTQQGGSPREGSVQQQEAASMVGTGPAIANVASELPMGAPCCEKGGDDSIAMPQRVPLAGISSRTESMAPQEVTDAAVTEALAEITKLAEQIEPSDHAIPIPALHNKSAPAALSNQVQQAPATFTNETSTPSATVSNQAKQQQNAAVSAGEAGVAASNEGVAPSGEQQRSSAGLVSAGYEASEPSRRSREQQPGAVNKLQSSTASLAGPRQQTNEVTTQSRLQAPAAQPLPAPCARESRSAADTMELQQPHQHNQPQLRLGAQAVVKPSGTNHIQVTPCMDCVKATVVHLAPCLYSSSTHCRAAGTVHILSISQPCQQQSNVCLSLQAQVNSPGRLQAAAGAGAVAGADTAGPVTPEPASGPSSASGVLSRGAGYQNALKRSSAFLVSVPFRMCSGILHCDNAMLDCCLACALQSYLRFCQ